MDARVFPGDKRPEQEADPSTVFSAEVKNEWSYSSAIHGKDRHNFAVVQKVRRGNFFNTDTGGRWVKPP
jgi:hypothetical protein